jgi:hypothetical protein
LNDPEENPMELSNRTYTLEEATNELHVSEEVLTELLPKLGSDVPKRSPLYLTEEELNRAIDLLNAPEA